MALVRGRDRKSTRYRTWREHGQEPIQPRSGLADQAGLLPASRLRPDRPEEVDLVLDPPAAVRPPTFML